jgi:hypothetical protein
MGTSSTLCETIGAMKRSADLAAATQKFYDAFSTGDAETVTGLMSTADGLLFIGTDPSEWLTDHASVTALLAAQVGAGLKVRGGDIQAFEEGAAGWVADRGAFILPDGSEVPFRLTAVFHKQDGAWRIVQAHASFPVSNEDAVGVEL